MEIRKDYILERYVFYAPERKKRKREFKKTEKIKEGVCFFCPGNENLTPPEIGRIGENNKWGIRWFPNKFPVVDLKSKAYGYHEVIVETPSHEEQIWDLGKEQLKKLLEVYKQRIGELSGKKRIKYVTLFKNQGREAGTSLVHSHTQLVALDRIPTLVNEEIKANGKKCRYCGIIKKEEKTKRLCFKNKSFIAFCPYASRFNYEIWIFPIRHLKNLPEFSEEEISDLANILKKALLKLKELNASYNFYLHYAPAGENLHFHIEICPRMATWAGFELSSDFVINSVLPEEAAGFYRGKA